MYQLCLSVLFFLKGALPTNCLAYSNPFLFFSLDFGEHRDNLYTEIENIRYRFLPFRLKINVEQHEKYSELLRKQQYRYVKNL